MRIRALNSNGDWTFGAGQNNYAQAQPAAQLLIQMRVLSFLGDCFFDSGSGISWFQFLGETGDNNQIALNLAISAVILNTLDQNGNQVVLGLQQLNINLNRQTRNLTVSYAAITTFSQITGAFTYDFNGINNNGQG